MTTTGDESVLEVGEFRVDFPLDGMFKLDGGAMFGVVPKPLWSRRAESDDRNRIQLAARPMLLRNGERTILVDTGIGNRWSQKEQDIYDIQLEPDGIRGSLSDLDVSPDEVTDVVFTHLHFDHAGATTYRNTNGKLELTFPRATHHVQTTNWEWAHNPTERDTGSYRKEDFSLLENSKPLNLLEGDTELFPGVTCLRVDGHTKGLQIIRVRGDDQSLLYVTDVIPTTAHLPLPYVMGYDLWPLETLEVRKQLLPDAEANQHLLAFEHDPKTVVATVHRPEKRYEVRETVVRE